MTIDAIAQLRRLAGRRFVVAVGVLVVGSLLVDVAPSAAKNKGSATTQDIVTVAGNGQQPPSNQVVPPSNVPATSNVELGSPLDMVTDSHGNILIADQNNNVIRAVAAATGRFYGQSMVAGRIYTIMGNVDGNAGDQGYAAAGLLGIELNDPNGVAVDAQGDIAVTDSGNDAVEFYCAVSGFRYGVEMDAGIVYTIAGGGTEGDITQGGQALTAGLTSPDGIAFGPSGNIVVSDTGDDLLRVVPQYAGTFYGQAMRAGDIYTIAGQETSAAGGIYGYSGNGGPATSALISIEPFDGLAVDASGDVVFPDADNNVVRVVAGATHKLFGQEIRTGDIYTIAGTGKPAYSISKKGATASALNDPQGVVFDTAGDLLVSDAGNNVIRVIPAASGTYGGKKVKVGDIYTIAGNKQPGYIGNGVAATDAELNSPAGVAVGPSGQVIVADNGNNVIRELVVAPAPPVVSGIKPKSGDTLGDKKVTIVGVNLEGATSVTFGDHAASTFEVVSPKKIVAYSPLSSPGTVGITVTTPNGSSEVTSGTTYTFVNSAHAEHVHGARRARRRLMASEART